MSPVEKIENTLVGMSLRLNRTGGIGTTGPKAPPLIKGFGDPPPPLADIRNNALLLPLFALQGLVGRLHRKLQQSSGKEGRIVPAKGEIACADQEDTVYLGVDFLEEYHQEEDTVAGILAHEWGHLVSEFTEIFDANELHWDKIAQIRQEEECRADAYAGRLLAKMGYNPEGLIRLLTHPNFKKETQKYYPPEIRAQIIRVAFEAQRRFKNTAQKLKLFKETVYPNPHKAHFIAIA